MFGRVFCLVLFLIVLLLAASACQGPASGTDDGSASNAERHWAPPPLTDSAGELPEGRDILRRNIDFMQGHRQVAFHATVTYEVVQENGQKLHFDMLHRVAMQRPDRLFWVTLHDDATVDSAWCGDGEFTLLKQPANLWARIDVPLDLSDAVTRLSEEYRVAVPFVDLLSGDVAELWLGDDVLSVDYIGESWVEGWWTDHVAVRKPGVEFELWIRQGDEPFPAKIALVLTDEPGLPGNTARFREWATEIPKGSIPSFKPPEGSERVEAAPVSRD